MVYKTISIKEAMKRPEATGSRGHTVGPAEALPKAKVVRQAKNERRSVHVVSLEILATQSLSSTTKSTRGELCSG